MAKKTKEPVEWVKVTEAFGSALPHGSCNALVTYEDGRTRICGFPRKASGKCLNGHPAQPTNT